MPRRKTARRKRGGYEVPLLQSWQNTVSTRQSQVERKMAELRYMQPDDPLRPAAVQELQNLLNYFWVGIDRAPHMEDPIVLRAFEVTDEAQDLIDEIIMRRMSGTGKKKRRATRRRRVVRKV